MFITVPLIIYITLRTTVPLQSTVILLAAEPLVEIPYFTVKEPMKTMFHRLHKKNLRAVIQWSPQTVFKTLKLAHYPLYK